MAGQPLIDFAHQQWFAICPHGVVARHGGYAVYEAGAWQWRSAPFVNAWRVLVDGERWWVDTPSILWEHAGGVWTPHHELTFDAALDLVPRVRTSVRRDPSARELLACPASPPPIVFSNVVASDQEVWRLSDGSWRVIATAGQLPAPGWRFRAATSDGRGGAWIVDDAGALLHHDGLAVEVVRTGYITTWQRHTYPDSEPDGFSDQVTAAAVSRAGTTATYRFDGSRGVLTVTHRDGTVRERHVTGDHGRPASPLFGFVGEQLAISTWDRLDTLVPPEPSIIDAAGSALRFTVAGKEFSSPIFVPGPALEPAVDSVAVGRETWSIDDGALAITCDAARFVPDLGARIVGLFPRGTSQFGLEPGAPVITLNRSETAPLVVDVYGGVHIFDGARFLAAALDPAIECLIAARRAGTIFIANTRTMVWVTAPEVPRVEPIVELAAIRARLVRSVTVFEAQVSAKPRDHVVPQLAGFRRIGRTHASIALARLLAGSDDAPGPEDHAELAASIVAGCDLATDFYLSDGGWVAVGSNGSLAIGVS